MKVLIDTNIILDVLCNRKEYVLDSLNVLKYCESKQITGYISSLSIANIIYIMGKELDNIQIANIIQSLSIIFTITDLKEEDLKKACVLEFNDYEDALQSVQANRIKANYIITRNTKNFKKSNINVVDPKKFNDLMINSINV